MQPDCFIPTAENISAALAALRDECSEGQHYRILPRADGYRWQGLTIYQGYAQAIPVATAPAARADAVSFFAHLNGATAEQAQAVTPPFTPECERLNRGGTAA